MSILVQNVSMQQLKHEFESFLKRFYRKLLVLQPQIYIISNITKDAVHLQIVWKSISANGYVTYNTCSLISLTICLQSTKCEKLVTTL